MYMVSTWPETIEYQNALKKLGEVCKRVEQSQLEKQRKLLTLSNGHIQFISDFKFFAIKQSKAVSDAYATIQFRRGEFGVSKKQLKELENV